MYCYKGCGTCKKALAWLADHGLEVEVIPIRETPPSVAELKTMLGHQGGQLKRLLNTSSRDYRELGLKDQLPELSEAAVFALLQGHGNLVKRPFLLGPDFGLVGFKPEVWAEALLPGAD